jgi:hypothetical protein
VCQWNSGKDKVEIVRYLVGRGWPRASATRFVSSILSGNIGVDDIRHRAIKQAPHDQMLLRMMLIVAVAAAVIVAVSLVMG